MGIGLVFVPKHLTFLLQPLDVMVFQVLKRNLREAWVEARTRVAGGEVDMGNTPAIGRSVRGQVVLVRKLVPRL